MATMVEDPATNMIEYSSTTVVDGPARRMLLRALNSTTNLGNRMGGPVVGFYDRATCANVSFSDTLHGISVTAKGADPRRIILHFHGGAHCMGSVWSTRELVGRLSSATRAHVISVDYRLAPDDPFPAGLDDALTAWRWVRMQYPQASVAIAGDSAGGNLAFALMVKLAQLQEPQPVACIGMSPWLLLDDNALGERVTRETSTLRNIWDRASVRAVARYCQGHDTADPLVSPLLASEDIVQCFPPVLIHAAEDEPLADDAREMVKLCERCGVGAELELFPGALHVFQAIPMKQASKASLEHFATFLERHWEQ